MEYRLLGKTGYRVSVISLGTWAFGGSWGPVDDRQSLAALHKAVDLGVNFFDTADAYGNGRAEKVLAQLKKERKGEIIVATKAGRRLKPHTAEGYNLANLTDFVDRSLACLESETIDLLQLHCPPTSVYGDPEVFDALDRLVQSGKIRHYGVSVEKIEEGIQAIKQDGVETVQIIFNIFRQRPSEIFFSAAKERQVGILARVPLASGLLTGKLKSGSFFPPDDHRNYNRQGSYFDHGETFSGVDFETGLQAVDELRNLLPPGVTLAQLALRWILMFNEVSCAIPGAKRSDQVIENLEAFKVPPFTVYTMAEICSIYDRHIRPQVHNLW